MAFIEGSRGNVLFTGDFRLPLYCASRLPFLKDQSLSRDVLTFRVVTATNSKKSDKDSSKIEHKVEID